MTPNIKPLVAGNWKMNGSVQALAELEQMVAGYDTALQAKTDIMICPPAILLSLALSKTTDTDFQIGAQDCHANISGAHTGDISAGMVRDIGANAVIVGHSERRTDHSETNEAVLAKAKAGIAAKLMTIICIGESEAERKSGETLNVLKDQMQGSLPDIFSSHIVIAYEPVWAIGTGLTPTAQNVKEAHEFMREELVQRYGDSGNTIRLLYGGSVKPGNAKELMSIANVDGALVGGASLKAEDFLGICAAYL